MICAECIKDKPEEEFVKKIGSGLAKRCLLCRERQGKYQLKSYGKGMRPIDYKRLREYGLTKEAYQEMLDKQDHKCVICRTPEEDRALCIDHNHSTGKVRGLLCDLCNRGLGQFQDRTDLLLRAVKYLELGI